MGLFSRIKNKITSWLSGGKSEKKTPPKVRVQYNNRDARNQVVSSRTSYGGGRFTADVDDAKEKKRVVNAFKAKKGTYKSMVGDSTPDPKEAARKASRQRAREALKRADNSVKRFANNSSTAEKKYRNESDKRIAARREKINDALDKAYQADPKRQLVKQHRAEREVDRENFNRATDNRYNVSGAKDSAEKLKRRQAQKMQEYDADLAKFQVSDDKTRIGKTRRAAESAARGVTNAVTWGGSNMLAAHGTKGEAREAEEYYQKHKDKAAETVGEIAGSFISFGGATKGTAGAAEKIVASKAGSKAVAKLAGTKAIKRSAEKAALKQLEKGAIKTTTKGAAEEIAKAKAKKLATALVEDAIMNNTVGRAYDFNNATSQYKIGSDEWKKEMLTSSLFNLGAGTLTAGVANRGATKEALETLAKRETKEALQKETRRFLQSRGSASGILDSLDLPSAKTARESADRLPIARGVKGSSEAPNINPNLYEDVEKYVRTKKPKTTELGGIDVRKPKDLSNEEKRGLKELKQRLNNEISEIESEALRPTEESKRLKRQVKKIDNVLDKSEGITKTRKTEEVTLEEAIENQKSEVAGTVNTEAKATEKATENSADDGVQMTLEDAMKASEKNDTAEQTAKSADKAEGKAKKPKTKKQKAQEESAERQYLDGVMRKREEKLNSSVRNQTGGEYAYRQGEHTAAAHASVDEAKRINEEQKKVGKMMRDGNVAELFENNDNYFGVYKTANKAELEKAASEAVTRVRGDMQGAITRLRELDSRLMADVSKNSALSSAEHITLNDVADITAIRNIFEEAGETLPKEYEEAFSHIIEWQRTEAAQGLKAIDLFLKENDKSYRRAFLSRDIDRYMRKVLNADDTAIADIKRSLDANHGAGYYDKMINALSEFKGQKNEAAFRKAYADFQAEIFMNTKPTVWDTVNLFRHTLMLSSPKTGGNNIIGNVMQRVMYDISDLGNMVGESIAQGINKDAKRTTAFLKTKDQRRLANMFTNGKLGEANLKRANYITGFADQEFADAVNNAANADIAEMMESSKYMGDVIKGLKYNPTTAGGKIKSGATKIGSIGNKYVSLMLNEPDSWFVERNYRSAFLKYLEANGINSAESLKNNERVFQEARAYAKDIALENTYKKSNNVVSFLEGLRTKGHTKGSGAGYKLGAIVLDAELPYLKVPANLVINNFKYSPLGVFNVATDAYKYVVNGDVEALNKATRDLSKSLTGTGMAALGYMMFCQDQADSDSWGFIGNAEDALKEYGVRDNSFKIGNKNFSIANLGIGSVQFLMGASLAEDLAKQGTIPAHQVVLDSLSKNIDTVADMSLMENAVSLLDLFGNGGDYNATVSDRLGRAGMEVVGDYAAQFLPNPMRGVAKGLTDADLDTGVRKGDTTKVQQMLERNKNNFIQGVPVLNEKVLPHRVDTHGNLIGERKTNRDKLNAVLNNTLNPLSPKTVNIPEADKEEMKVLKEKSGEPFKPNVFDKDRKYELSIGTGDMKETVKFTGKEREQAARAAKNSGYDMANALVKKGMFGDRLGNRAQSVLSSIPDDEEKAREMIFSTPEWKNASNEQKEKWLNAMYGQGTGNTDKGVSRTRKAEAFINIAGNSEGDFRWQNDISSSYQKKYNDAGLADLGIEKGVYVDVLEACKDSNHKWKEDEKKNQDTINSAKKTKAGILSVEGLTAEQRIAIYQTIRGKRTGFGWNDWDGVSSGGSYYRRGGYRRYRRRGGGGGKTKVPALKQSAYKASKATYKSLAESLVPRTTSKVSTASPIAKITPPKVKFKEYEV